MMTRKLKEHLNSCVEAMQSANLILTKYEFPADNRTMTVIGLISLLNEHLDSIFLLVMHDKIGSAFALLRPVVEGAYRALWISLPATDAEVKRFNEKDEIDLRFGGLAKALDDAYGIGTLFQDMKTRAWKLLNSFTHGGMDQIGRRFIKHEVANNYSEEEIYGMTSLITSVVLLTFSIFLQRHDHTVPGLQIQSLLNTFGTGSDS